MIFALIQFSCAAIQSFLLALNVRDKNYGLAAWNAIAMQFSIAMGIIKLFTL